MMSAGRAHTSHRTSVRHAGHGLREGSVERPAEDKFCIFISHKHEDHALAMAVRDALHRLGCGRIECFVSGVDIAAGADWNRQIKSALAQSHLLILLFTSPSRELGLVPLRGRAVHALRRRRRLRHRLPLQSGNRLAATTRQPAGCRPRNRRPSRSSSASCCRETWCISDDWRRGRARMPTSTSSSSVPRRNRSSPPSRRHRSRNGRTTRVTVSCSTSRQSTRSARSSRSRRGSSKAKARLRASRSRSSTGPTGGARCRWRDLLDAVDGVDAAWRHQLDRRFVAALNEELFSPISATLRGWNQGRRHQRVFKPVLYRIVRAPVAASTTGVAARPK